MLRSRLPFLGFGALVVVAASCSSAGDDEADGPEPSESLVAGASDGTVAQAVASSCNTASVKGLSLQIIEEGNCISPGAYAEVPALPNLTFPSNVFPFLETPARDHLVTALKANPNKSMTVASMLRTVAQQYLVYRWNELGTCGIAAAAKAGRSNHETGLAVDVSEYSSWKSALSSAGFSWLGSSDPQHFDYDGAGAVDHRGIDVKAFQRLWNRNNPGDKIAEDGDWGPQTESRMKKSPASGFPIGASCSPTPDPDPDPSSSSSSSASSSGGGTDDGEPWSCNGSYATTKVEGGQYYTTSFGCWVDADGDAHSDSGDNCIPYCLSQAKSSGLCSGMSGPQCERNTNWYAADAGRFGCMTRLRLTSPKNGKQVVVVVLDAGPACWVEDQVEAGVLDLSSRVTEYLFGGPVGVGDAAKVQVEEVPASTPLGPQ